MSNLFAALEQSNSEPVAMQLALLESVSTSNAVFPKVKVGWNALISGADKVGKLFGSKTTIVGGADTRDLKTRVQETYAAHRDLSAPELTRKIRAACVSRMGCGASDSDILVSVRVIEEAAKFYDLDAWLTPGEKAQAVIGRHKEESLANLRKRLPR